MPTETGGLQFVDDPTQVGVPTLERDGVPVFVSWRPLNLSADADRMTEEEGEYPEGGDLPVPRWEYPLNPNS